MTMCRIFKVDNLEFSPGYKIIMGHLKAYQKKAAFQAWEEYRKAIPDDMLATMQEIFIECRRNGFVNPHVRNDQIVFDQVTAQGSCGDTDPCTMCARECEKREAIDTEEIKKQRGASGTGYQEPLLCWQTDAKSRSGYSGNRKFQGPDMVKIRYRRGFMAGKEMLLNVDVAKGLESKNKIDYV